MWLYVADDVYIDYPGHGGRFVSEFIAYHAVWYQDIHADEGDEAQCVRAGHIHVGQFVPVEIGTEAAKVTLRTVIDHVRADLGLGDYDADGDVDLFDVAEFIGCVTGPGGGLETGCAIFDMDWDEDIDWNDFGLLQLVYTGE